MSKNRKNDILQNWYFWPFLENHGSRALMPKNTIFGGQKNPILAWFFVIFGLFLGFFGFLGSKFGPKWDFWGLRNQSFDRIWLSSCHDWGLNWPGIWLISCFCKMMIWPSDSLSPGFGQNRVHFLIPKMAKILISFDFRIRVSFSSFVIDFWPSFHHLQSSNLRFGCHESLPVCDSVSFFGKWALNAPENE